MLTTTVSRIRCLACGGELELMPSAASAVSFPEPIEVRSGRLNCPDCRRSYLILGGIALLVEDVQSYLLQHVKGVSRIVSDGEIPAELLADYLEAKQEIGPEHIEEDLEAERVNALYLMNHYLRSDSELQWWKPSSESGDEGSPLIERLIREHWDQGPMAQIGNWLKEAPQPFGAVVELGCGVGGMLRAIRPSIKSGYPGYLGMDSSFASVALARHLSLGAPYPHSPRIPGDLLRGAVSREAGLVPAGNPDGSADFVVADLGTARPPLVAGDWDLTIALNTIDMLEEPAELPRLQHELLRPGGVAIQSCPYVWHEQVARRLRERLPVELRGDSARAVEWLYRQQGFQIEQAMDHLPWLFFKHARQLEIYSVHLFAARKLT